MNSKINENGLGGLQRKKIQIAVFSKIARQTSYAITKEISECYRPNVLNLSNFRTNVVL